jgi:hypothetical protein
VAHKVTDFVALAMRTPYQVILNFGFKVTSNFTTADNNYIIIEGLPVPMMIPPGVTSTARQILYIAEFQSDANTPTGNIRVVQLSIQYHPNKLNIITAKPSDFRAGYYYMGHVTYFVEETVS